MPPQLTSGSGAKAPPICHTSSPNPLAPGGREGAPEGPGRQWTQ